VTSEIENINLGVWGVRSMAENRAGRRQLSGEVTRRRKAYLESDSSARDHPETVKPREWFIREGQQLIRRMP
jgi:hypothetical protein